MWHISCHKTFYCDRWRSNISRAQNQGLCDEQLLLLAPSENVNSKINQMRGFCHVSNFIWADTSKEIKSSIKWLKLIKIIVILIQNV